MDRRVIVLIEAPESRRDVAPVIVLEGDGPDEVVWPCKRCYSGDGHIAMYSHVAGGVCFGCQGSGGDPMDRAEAMARGEKLIKGRIARADAAERKRLRQLAERDAVKAALLAEYPALAVLDDPAVIGYGVDGQVVEPPMGQAFADMARDLLYEPHRFSPARAAAAAAAVERYQARAAEKAAKVANPGRVPTGRVRVEGQVVATWEVDDRYDYHGGTTLKWRVEVVDADGGLWHAIGTIPRALWDNGYEGDYRNLKGWRVAFDAAVEPAHSQREGELPAGWYKRPTKVAALAAPAEV